MTISFVLRPVYCLNWLQGSLCNSMPHTGILECLELYPWRCGKQANSMSSHYVRDLPRRCTIPTAVLHNPEPPSKVINKAGYRYTLQNTANISHLLYIYVFKLYARGKRDIDSFIHMIRIYSKDSGVSFRLEKCSRKQGMWQTESGPRSRTWSHSFIC